MTKQYLVTARTVINKSEIGSYKTGFRSRAQVGIVKKHFRP